MQAVFANLLSWLCEYGRFKLPRSLFFALLLTFIYDVLREGIDGCHELLEQISLVLLRLHLSYVLHLDAMLLMSDYRQVGKHVLNVLQGCEPGLRGSNDLLHLQLLFLLKSQIFDLLLQVLGDQLYITVYGLGLRFLLYWFSFSRLLLLFLHE